MDDESRDKLVRFCIDNDITYLAVFGSTIKGAAHPDSDIDLIVRFKNRIGLIAMVRLQRDLETLLGKKVDLVTEKSISIHFRAQVLEEAETIYDAA